MTAFYIPPTTEAPAVITSSTIYVHFTYVGALLDDEVWAAGWTAPVDGEFTVGAIAAQDAPVGADVAVDVTLDGTPDGNVSTLLDGTNYQETVYGTAIAVTAGQVVHPKTTGVGSTSPGQNITFTLKFVPA